MNLLEDIKSGKYNLIIIILVFVFIFHLYHKQSCMEKMTDTSEDTKNMIKETIKNIYNADVESIRNLAEVATKLQKEGLTIPGDLRVTGNIIVDSNLTVGSDLTVGSKDKTDGNIYLLNKNGNRGTHISANRDNKGGSIYLYSPDKNDGNYITYDTSSLTTKGMVIAWSGTEPPKGWALCDGQKIGDFQTPDLRGRFIRMFSDNLPGEKSFADYVVQLPMNSKSVDNRLLGTSTTNINSLVFKMKIGEYGGTDHQQLSILEMPQHTHGMKANNACFKDGGCDSRMTLDNNGPLKIQTEINGGASGHNNIPPFYVLAYIIKL